MSVSKFNITITTEKAYAYFAHISVFSSDHILITPASNLGNQLNYKLKKGLYTLRVELNGEICDSIITADKDKKIRVAERDGDDQSDTVINLPPQFSSALLSSTTYQSSHEYYTHPSTEISRRNTLTLKDKPSKHQESSLFIFLRFSSLEKYQEYKKENETLFYKDFKLVNQNHDIIVDFNSGKGIEADENFGWVAFSAQLPYGMYYLIYEGENSRQIPIYVFRKWHTQFFMTVNREPLFGSIRVFISKARAFDPDKPTNKYIDILLDKLQNREYSINEELLHTVAIGKYDSPMLGLICLYVYFKGNPSIRNDLFYTILNNLKNNILKGNNDSPDIVALEILASLYFDKKSASIKNLAIKETPMLRAGFETIIQASLEYENLVPQNSTNDFVAESICYDSPFTTFKPISLPKNKENLIFHVDEINNDQFNDSEFFLESIQDSAEPKQKITLDHFKDSFFSEKFNDKNISESDNSWVQNSISEMLAKDKNLTISDLSRELVLPKSTIVRILGNTLNGL